MASVFLSFQRLKEVADRINRLGQVTQPGWPNLRSTVKRITLGPTHIALLLEEGRICRVSYSVISDRLDLTKTDPNKKYACFGCGLRKISSGVCLTAVATMPVFPGTEEGTTWVDPVEISLRGVAVGKSVRGPE